MATPYNSKLGRVSRKKRGRPTTGPLEYARAAFWARSVQFVARKKFAELEREISPDSIVPRDGGGYSQPHAWGKYARGERAPFPPEMGGKSPVVRAEAIYPGTMPAYLSITWDMLHEYSSQLIESSGLAARLSPCVQKILRHSDIAHIDSNRIVLSPEGYAYASRIPHFDVLGLMLMQWRGETWPRLDSNHIFYARIWLTRASRLLFPFRMTRNLLLPLIETHVPELGSLSGLSLSKTSDQVEFDVLMAHAHLR